MKFILCYTSKVTMCIFNKFPATRDCLVKWQNTSKRQAHGVLSQASHFDPVIFDESVQLTRSAMSSLTISTAPFCGTVFTIQEHLPHITACACCCSTWWIRCSFCHAASIFCGSAQLQESSVPYNLQNTTRQTLEIWKSQIWHSTKYKQMGTAETAQWAKALSA